MLADFHYTSANNLIKINRTETQVEIINDDDVIYIIVDNDIYEIPMDTIKRETHLNEEGNEENPEQDVYECADGAIYEIIWP